MFSLALALSGLFESLGRMQAELELANDASRRAREAREREKAEHEYMVQLAADVLAGMRAGGGCDA